MKHSVKEEFYKTLYNQPMESKEILCSSDIMEKIFSLESVDRGPDKFDLQKEIHSTKQEQLELIRDIIENNLPFLEKEIIKRVYFDNMKQDGIGALYNIKQEMVCYYKKRAIKRIKYYLNAKKIDIEEMEKNLTTILTKKQLQAMMYYFKKHNQQSIAEEFNITQSAISSRLKLGIKQIRQAYSETSNEEFNTYYNIFKYLFEFNSLQSSQMRKKEYKQREVKFIYAVSINN